MAPLLDLAATHHKNGILTLASFREGVDGLFGIWSFDKLRFGVPPATAKECVRGHVAILMDHVEELLGCFNHPLQSGNKPLLIRGKDPTFPPQPLGYRRQLVPHKTSDNGRFYHQHERASYRQRSLLYYANNDGLAYVHPRADLARFSQDLATVLISIGIPVGDTRRVQRDIFGCYGFDQDKIVDTYPAFDAGRLFECYLRSFSPSSAS